TRLRTVRRILWAAVAVVVVATTLAWWAGGAPTTSTERLASGPAGPAPDFRLEDLRDPQATVSLADYSGRPVVVNFWASWCPPCRKEMPALEAAYRKVKGRVAFVGVNHQDARDDALALLDDAGVTYRSGYDPNGNVAPEYGLFGMPTTVFVSADGEILERITGAMTEDRLLETIESVFDVRAS
ncbi:MAG: TlpA family protein disulfide reductase, partial [Nitriliruptorales bacterium]